MHQRLKQLLRLVSRLLQPIRRENQIFAKYIPRISFHNYFDDHIKSQKIINQIDFGSILGQDGTYTVISVHEGDNQMNAVNSRLHFLENITWFQRSSFPEPWAPTSGLQVSFWSCWRGAPEETSAWATWPTDRGWERREAIAGEPGYHGKPFYDLFYIYHAILYMFSQIQNYNKEKLSVYPG